MPVNAGQPLHASNVELLDNPGCKEVNPVGKGGPGQLLVFSRGMEGGREGKEGKTERRGRERRTGG